MYPHLFVLMKMSCSSLEVLWSGPVSLWTASIARGYSDCYRSCILTYVGFLPRLRPTGATTLFLDRPERAAAQQLQLVTEARGHGVLPANWTCVRRNTTQRSSAVKDCSAANTSGQSVNNNFNQDQNRRMTGNLREKKSPTYLYRPCSPAYCTS